MASPAASRLYSDSPQTLSFLSPLMFFYFSKKENFFHQDTKTFVNLKQSEMFCPTVRRAVEGMRKWGGGTTWARRRRGKEESKAFGAEGS